jgi:hypothetical protein
VQELDRCVGWRLTQAQRHCRALCRQHYPVIVTYHERTEPAYTWGHYYQGEDRDFTHTAERVLRMFWVTLARTKFFSLHHIRLTQS